MAGILVDNYRQDVVALDRQQQIVSMGSNSPAKRRKVVREVPNFPKELLVEAIRNGDLKRVEQQIFPVDRDYSQISLDDQGHTAVHWAAALGEADILEMLIAHGAQTNAVNVSGETPLHRAVRWEFAYTKNTFLRILHMLKSNLSVVATSFDARYTPVEVIPTLLPTKKLAAEHYLEIIITEWLDGRIKLDLNAKNEYGYTFLMKCAQGGSFQLVDLLLKAGADPLIQNFQQASALDLTTNPKIRQLLPGGDVPFTPPTTITPTKSESSPEVTSSSNGLKRTRQGARKNLEKATLESSSQVDLRKKLIADFELFLDQTTKKLVKNRSDVDNKEKHADTAKLGLELVTSMLDIPLMEGNDTLLRNSKNIIMKNKDKPVVRDFLLWFRNSS